MGFVILRHHPDGRVGVLNAIEFDKKENVDQMAQTWVYLFPESRIEVRNAPGVNKCNHVINKGF